MYCTVAQLVERRTVNAVVPGSSPGSAACVGLGEAYGLTVTEAPVRPTPFRLSR